MKMVFDVARLISRQPQGWAKSSAFCLALALVATAGCSKSSPPPQAVAPPVSSDSTSARQAQAPAPVPVPGGTQPVVAADADDSQKTLQGLNRALLGWTIRNRRHPQTFEEFAGSAGFQIPAPPAGKKYSLSPRGFVILVNN
jgi:hypothetical protein